MNLNFVFHYLSSASYYGYGYNNCLENNVDDIILEDCDYYDTWQGYVQYYLESFAGYSEDCAGCITSLSECYIDNCVEIVDDKNQLIKKPLDSDKEELVFLSNKGNIISFGKLSEDLFKPNKVLI